MELTNVITPADNCPVREVGDGFIILAADGETTHSLDGLGAFIWARLDGQRDLAAVLADIVAEYDVKADTASRDLLEFASALQQAGLVTST